MKKGCLWTLGLGFGLLLVGWLTLIILQHTVAAWPDPVPGVRLEPSRPILAAADVTPDNAFYYIRQWKDACVQTSRLTTQSGDCEARLSAYGPAGAPYPEIDAQLAANAENLELARKAAATPKCQVVTALSFNDLFPYLAKTRALVKLLCYRAESAAAAGDWNAATCDLRTALVISSHLSRGGPLIHRLVSIAVHGITTATIRRIAFEQNPPPEFLKEMDALLAEIAGNLEPPAEALRHERVLLQNELSSIVGMMEDDRRMAGAWGCATAWLYRHGLLFCVCASPEKVRSHLDIFISRVIAAYETKEYVTISRMQTCMGTEFRKRGGLGFVNDPIGSALVILIVPGYVWAVDNVFRERASLDATRVVLAVRRWQLDHGGKLPAALADLVPAYIAAVPEDPFSPKHEPLRYRTDGTTWAVYSVDKDGKDDGGRYSWADSDDRQAHPAELDLVFASDEFQKKRAKYDKAHPKK